MKFKKFILIVFSFFFVGVISFFCISKSVTNAYVEFPDSINLVSVTQEFANDNYVINRTIGTGYYVGYTYFVFENLDTYDNASLFGNSNLFFRIFYVGAGSEPMKTNSAQPILANISYSTATTTYSYNSSLYSYDYQYLGNVNYLSEIIVDLSPFLKYNDIGLGLPNFKKLIIIIDTNFSNSSSDTFSYSDYDFDIFHSNGTFNMYCLMHEQYNYGYDAGYSAGYDAGFVDGGNSSVADAYNSGYTAGQTAGYSAGLNVGQSLGYVSGYTAGQTAGYSAGYLAGLDNINQEQYDLGYSAGQTAGYESGYTAGYEAGQTAGYSAGYEAGLIGGYDSAYEDGFDAGETAGYVEGWDDGYNVGYDYGYTAGQISAQEGTENFSTNWFVSILSGVGGILSIEIFPNFRIGFLLLIPVVFGLFYWLIGMLKGGER